MARTKRNYFVYMSGKRVSGRFTKGEARAVRKVYGKRAGRGQKVIIRRRRSSSY